MLQFFSASTNIVNSKRAITECLENALQGEPDLNCDLIFQAQIIRFLKVEQDLVDARSKLDRDLSRFKSIQTYSQRVLGAESIEEFAGITIESVVETFEVECSSFFVFDKTRNILSNAVDSIENEGTITISTSILNDIVQIIIKDTGNGIPENIRGKIFDPFFTTKGVGKGTGLGLSITQSIIEKHRGSIKVKSEAGVGSEFVISLPLKQEKE
jgi:K+-sensing histidine kinase KdpD